MFVDEDEDGEKESGNDAAVPAESDGDESIYFDVDEGGATSNKNSVTFNNALEVTEIPATKLCTVEEKIRTAKTELLFPDEVETPHDTSARERFAKYRGIPSFSECIWPTENDTSLPYEYSKIFRFVNCLKPWLLII